MSTFLRIVRYLRPYKWLFALSLVSLLISVPINLLNPLFWKFGVDEVLISDEPRFVEWFGGSRVGLLFGGVLSAMLVAQILGSVIGALHGYLLGIVANRVGYDMRTQLYGRMQSHSIRFFHDSRSGDLVARASGDVDRVTRLAANGVDELIGSGVQLIVAWGIVFALSWQVALSLLAPMLAVGLLVWRYNKLVRPLYRAARERLGDVSAKLQENILGMTIIKAFAREPLEQQRVEKECREYYDTAIKGLRARTMFSPKVQIVGSLSNLVMLGVGGYFVLQGSFTLGSLVALRGYWHRLFAPIWSLARVNDRVQRSVAAAERVFYIMDLPVEIEDPDDPVELEPLQGSISLENVAFAYSEQHPQVLSDLSARIEPDEMLGVVGPSGAGKSTLLSLLMRFYDPTAGRITVDGHDLREVAQEQLRGHTALVSQDPFLFNATIRENILYGRLDASEQEMFQAARQADAHDFILALPDGYETVVGERGVKLSGGQKQRICIARAFLANPRILLLDEATAAVEPESEATIQAALDRLMQGRTSVVISHRLSMVRGARQILVIRDGGVQERGTHDELMALDGWYARMYRMQMGETDVAPG